jgi:penicillin-binding protein 2
LAAPSEQSSTHVRLTILVVIVACLFVALFARLWFLQVINAPKAQAAAKNNGVELIYTPAPRGWIYDSQGRALVGTINEPVIEVERQAAVDNPAMVARLAPLLGMTVKQLTSAINNLQYSPYGPVPVMPDATAQQILYVQENPGLFPGVTATTESVSDYTVWGAAAANIVGYVGQIGQSQYQQLKSKGYLPNDQIGLAGVEATYESVLRGTPGVEKVQVNSQGQVLTTLSSTPPVQGHSLVLTIDARVQQAAVVALEQGLVAARQSTHNGTPFPAPAAAAVVENPQNGAVIALATDPDYDPNEFIGGISNSEYAALNNPAANQPLLDRTIQGEYAPGSTFKLVTATAGLKYGLITPTSIFDDTGSIKIGNQTFTNNDGEVLGPINLTQAITASSDNYFNEIGAELWDGYYSGNAYPENALQDVAAEYGFGKPTGIALPGEDSGLVPTPQSVAKDYQLHPQDYATGTWYTGDSAQTAIGQFEDLVTPLQLANAYSTFANGGTLWQPRLAQAVENQNGRVVKTYTSQQQGTVPMSPPDRQAILAGLQGVVQNPSGTAYGIFTGPLAADDIAGKTGTAQVQGKQSTSIFTSFAPATNPQYEVTAIMEQAGYGADVAGPVVRQIYDALYNLPVQPVSVVAESGAQT